MTPDFPRLPLGAVDLVESSVSPVVRFDLAEQSPGRAGLVTEALQNICLPLARTPYLPDASGSRHAREALAQFLTSQAQPTDPHQLILTSSTSASYQQLFKLFCAPGDAVLLPSPGYPLIEHLARLEGLMPLYFHWSFADGAWQLEMEELSALLAQARVRVVVLVSPATPIGRAVLPEVLLQVAAMIARTQSALIIDEVFSATRLDAPFPSLCPPVDYAQLGRVVVLNGLSKVMGLPGAKLGWISVYGTPTWQMQVLRGLAFLEDCTLGVGQGIQDALSEVLRHAPTMMRAICVRARRNRESLRKAVAQYPELTLFETNAGWHQMVRYPRLGVEDESMCAILEREHGVRLQSGALFALPVRGVVLGSLIVSPGSFDAGWREALAVLARGGLAED